MTMLQRFGRYARVLFAASAMILATVAAEAAVHYVTQGGGEGTKDGTSWTTAYDEAAFPAAILNAGAGDEIWVKPASTAPRDECPQQPPSSSRTALPSTADSQGRKRRAPTGTRPRHTTVFDGGISRTTIRTTRTAAL
jgi:hypothetical protein